MRQPSFSDIESGVDAGSGYAHSLETTGANVRDITITSPLIREDDAVVYGDAGYPGIEKREGIVSDARLSSIEYRINRRAGSVRKAPNHLPDYEKRIERRKSSIRSKVEHPFLIIKRFFGYIVRPFTVAWPKIRIGCICCSPARSS